MISSAILKEIIAIVIFAVIVLIVAAVLVKKPKKLNPTYFNEKWHELQKKLAAKDMWPMAVIDADKLLDEALKKRHYKGKTMGERLVAAQHDIKDNDAVWFAHKLRNQLVHENNVKLSQNKVKDALMGFKQALKDLGAL